MTLTLPGIDAPPPVGARRDADFYPTPENLWRPFAPVLARRLAQLPGMCSTVVEPACGDGRLLAHLEAMGVERRRLVGFDVRREAVAATRAAGYVTHRVDWTSPAAADHLARGGTSHVYVTNPPFSLALDFARTCVERAGRWGLTALLLRLTWLEPTTERAEWLAEHPADVWIPPTRGRFTDGGTDSATAAWFVWPPECPTGRGSYAYLARPPVSAFVWSDLDFEGVQFCELGDLDLLVRADDNRAGAYGEGSTIWWWGVRDNDVGNEVSCIGGECNSAVEARDAAEAWALRQGGALLAGGWR